MREIIFRGKKPRPSAFDQTDWVYGSLIDSGNHEQVMIYPWFNGASTMSVAQLVYTRMEAVEAETIGQYTGLVDMNDTKVFEGDIFQLEDDIIGVVIFDEGAFWLDEYGLRGAWTESGYYEYGGGWGKIECEPLNNWYVNRLKVAGNIYDNPELLEVINNGLR